MSDSVEVLYFYRTRWGAHDEFVELFRKNHWPILREQIGTGRHLAVEMWTPRFHGDGRADWDVLVSITYRDWAAIEEHSDAEIAGRLYPDQATFKARGAAPVRAARGALGRAAEPARAAGTLRRAAAISPTRAPHSADNGRRPRSQEVDPPPCRRSPS